MTTLKRFQLAAILLLVALIGFQGTGILIGWWTKIDVLSVIPQFIFAAIIGVFVWGFLKNIEHKLGKETPPSDEIPTYKPTQSLRNLEIYFVRAKGTSATPDFSQLKFIVDGSKGEAFPIHELPDWLEKPIKEHAIKWTFKENETSLRKYIGANFTVRNLDPSPETFGLSYSASGELIEDKRYANILGKLGDRKLDDLQIAQVERRYFLSHVTRILLIDHTHKKVWQAPPYWYVLVERGLINRETYGMGFLQDCKSWSKSTFGFEFMQHQYPDNEILNGSHIFPIVVQKT